MAVPTSTRAPTVSRARPATRPTLAVLSALTLGGTVWVLAPSWAATPFVSLGNLVVVLGFMAAALLLAGDPGQDGNARLLWAVGLFSLISVCGSRPEGALPWVCQVVGILVIPLVSTVVLRYPGARLDRIERAYVVVTAILVGGLRLVEASVSRPEDDGYPAGVWWPTVVTPRPALTAALLSWLDATFVVVLVALLGLLVRRFRRARSLDRALSAPVVVSGVCIGLGVACAVLYRLTSVDAARAAIYAVETATMLSMPAAFLVSGVRRALHRGLVSNLVLSLPRHPSPEDVEVALRRELADPGLRILYWVPEFAGHFAAGGGVPEAPAVVHRLRRTITSEDGVELAVVLVDPSMDRHPDVLDAMLSATALWLENGRLQAAVRAQVEDIKESRRRLRDAGESERRRIERDLHDGAQQRLLALKTRLAVAGVEVSSSIERELIAGVAHELQDAITELRGLARGLRPWLLAERGLPDAVHQVAERCPLAVTVSMPERRWDAGIEAAAYFTVCEALSNAVKHADAAHVTITVSDRGDHLRLEIDDDGRGGATVEPGGGLAGVRERVADLGGAMDVLALGRGTRVLMTVPCGDPAPRVRSTAVEVAAPAQDR